MRKQNPCDGEKLGVSLLEWFLLVHNIRASSRGLRRISDKNIAGGREKLARENSTEFWRWNNFANDFRRVISILKNVGGEQRPRWTYGYTYLCTYIYIYVYTYMYICTYIHICTYGAHTCSALSTDALVYARVRTQRHAFTIRRHAYRNGMRFLFYL